MDRVMDRECGIAKWGGRWKVRVAVGARIVRSSVRTYRRESRGMGRQEP